MDVFVGRLFRIRRLRLSTVHWAVLLGERNNLEQPEQNLRPSSPVYWRVEGSLLELTTVRPIAFFTWNAQ
ncbi:MAG TPA: hypothetical protein VGU64_06135, partial [Terriglobales bacterium]|nr:hypothetical protein [Terriglobales bacterium]